MKIIFCKFFVICHSLDRCAKYKLKLWTKAQLTWRFSAFAKEITSTTTRSFLAYIVAQGKLTWKYGEGQVSYPQGAVPPPLVGTKVIGPRSSDCPISTMLYNEWGWGWKSVWRLGTIIVTHRTWFVDQQVTNNFSQFYLLMVISLSPKSVWHHIFRLMFHSRALCFAILHGLSAFSCASPTKSVDGHISLPPPGGHQGDMACQLHYI